MYVEISLDKPRRLRYTINAMRELEKLFGAGIGNIFDPQKVGLDHVVHLIWVGLKHGGDRRLTVDETGDLLQEHFLDKGKELREVLDYALEGLRLAGLAPKAKEEEGSSENPPTIVAR